MRRALIVIPIGLIAFGIAVYLVTMPSCGCSPPTPVAGSQAGPVQTVASWFDAINSRNVSAAKQLVTPNEVAAQSEWAGTPSPAFTKLHCRLTSSTKSSAEVLCTFQEAPGSWSGNPDTFWSISLTKGTAGQWLVDNWGQG